MDILKANAARCRKLAESASDLEVKQALLDMADDMEAAVPILEQHAHRTRKRSGSLVSGSKEPLRAEQQP